MTKRERLLEEGIKLTMTDRNVQYGEPWENMTNIAGLWQAYLFGKYAGKLVDACQFSITAEDVAWLNVLQKAARSFVGRPNDDTYTDAAVYAAIAGECAFEDTTE